MLATYFILLFVSVTFFKYGAGGGGGGGSPGGGGGGGHPGGGKLWSEAGLVAHNIFRKIHNVGPLKLNMQMSNEAETYAKSLASSGTLTHSHGKDPRKGDGENLTMKCNIHIQRGHITAAEATKNWYKEVCNPGYNFKTVSNEGTGHFTQVVWKGSTEFGIGKANVIMNGMYCTFVVARYRPLGNMDYGNRDYQKNVLEGSFTKSMCDNHGEKIDDMIKDVGGRSSLQNNLNGFAVESDRNKPSESKRSE